MDQYSPKKTLSTSTQESFEALGECSGVETEQKHFHIKYRLTYF